MEHAYMQRFDTGSSGLAHLLARVRRAWLPALFGWIIGTGVQLLQPTLWSAQAYGALALLGALAAVWTLARVRAPKPAAIMMSGAAALLAFALVGLRAQAHMQALWPVALDGQTVHARWRIVDLPQRRSERTVFDAQLLAVYAIDDTGQQNARTNTHVWPTALERVRLSWRGSGAALDLQPGQEWQSVLRLRTPRGLANPYGFDAETWLWREGVFATGSVLSGGRWGEPQRVADDAWRYPMARARTAVRDAILARLQPVYGAGPTGLVAALVTGDQGAIPRGDWTAIRATGVAHLVAISGLHVTMFAALATVVVGIAWRALGQRWPTLLLRWPTPVAAAAGGVVLALGYAVFSGWGVPAQRTIMMLAVLVALQVSGRRWPWPVVWLAAMAAALLIDPWAMLQAGFWLSFVAVAVLFAQGVPWQPSGVVARARTALVQLISTQVVVTLALAPLTLLLFGQISLIGLLANAIAIPWVTLLLTPLALAGVVWPALWELAAWQAQGLLTLLHAMSEWPAAVWERASAPPLLATLGCVGAVWLVWRLPWRWRWWGALLMWPAFAYQPATPPPGRFEVLLPDIGQGSAAIVRTARHTLVYDTGPPSGEGDAAERVLLPWLRALNAQPSAIVISHDDSDHAGGMATLAQRFRDTEWWASFDPAGRIAHPVRRCQAGHAWEWDGVSFVFLHPPSPDYGKAGAAGDNARSCVLLVGRGEHAALLTGDITQAEEAALLHAYPLLRVGLLVLAHHGSRTSNSDAWLAGLQPRAVAMQAGWHNRYGHPHSEVLQRVQARAIPWANTATCGAITWRSEAPGQLECERQRRRFYWQKAFAD